MYLKIAVELTIDIVKVKKTLVDLKAKLQLLRTVKNERMEMSDTENSNTETLVFLNLKSLNWFSSLKCLLLWFL